MDWPFQLDHLDPSSSAGHGIVISRLERGKEEGLREHGKKRVEIDMSFLIVKQEQAPSGPERAPTGPLSTWRVWRIDWADPELDEWRTI